MTARIIKQTAAAVLLSAMLVQPALAATDSAKLQQFDALHDRLIETPSDLDLNVEYAELAVSIGDYEAAIPPLERLLMHNPDVPKLKLELGILYYLLGSNDVAKTYLTDAKNTAGDDAAISEQANDYLSKL